MASSFPSTMALPGRIQLCPLGRTPTSTPGFVARAASALADEGSSVLASAWSKRTRPSTPAKWKQSTHNQAERTGAVHRSSASVNCQRNRSSELVDGKGIEPSRSRRKTGLRPVSGPFVHNALRTSSCCRNPSRLPRQGSPRDPSRGILGLQAKKNGLLGDRPRRPEFTMNADCSRALGPPCGYRARRKDARSLEAPRSPTGARRRTVTWPNRMASTSMGVADWRTVSSTVASARNVATHSPIVNRKVGRTLCTDSQWLRQLHH